MKRKNMLLLLIGIAAVAVTGLALKDHLPGRGGRDPKAIGEDRTETSAGKKKGFETYTADFGDGYVMRFDYIPGLQELGTMEIGGVTVVDYGRGTTMLTATHVAADINYTAAVPHTAEEYLEVGNIAEFCDALPCKKGDAEGYAYWEKHEYSYGTGYTQGFNIFVGDEYFYIFVQQNDESGWPENIENVRIEKR